MNLEHDPADSPAPPREEGAALVLVTMMVLILSVSVIALTMGVRAQSRYGLESGVHDRQLRSADNALARAVVLAELNYATYESYSSPTDLIGTAGTPVDGAWVTIEKIAGGSTPPITFRLRSRGTVNGANGSRTIELIYRISSDPPPPLQGAGAGAVVGIGNFETSGNITIDGRDHYEADGSVRSDGGAIHVPGFTVTGSVTMGGSSDVGGMSEAPSGSPTEGIGMDSNSTVWDLEDGASAPNAGINADGVDNDGDGYTDENGFPTIWSRNFGVAYPHAFKTHAINKGTYFKHDNGDNKTYRHDGSNYVTDGSGNKIEYKDWVTSADAKDGGDVVLIEAQDGADLGNFSLPSNNSGSPSIVVVQNKDWTAGWSASGSHNTSSVDSHANHSNPYQDHDITIGPLHVDSNETFKGMLVADNIHHTNGSGTFLGSITSYNESNLGHFGNGTFNVHFSSEVLGGLPGVDVGANPPVASIQVWREVK